MKIHWNEGISAHKVDRLKHEKGLDSFFLCTQSFSYVMLASLLNRSLLLNYLSSLPFLALFVDEIDAISNISSVVITVWDF